MIHSEHPEPTFRCWRVERDAAGDCRAGVAVAPQPPTAVAGRPLVRVAAAGFNYKDALCCAGHPGVMRTTPLVPGIDVAGTLVEAAADLAAGSEVVVTGHGLGERIDGGFATHVQPPEAAVLPLPAGLSARDAMALGTAGLTAVIACDRLSSLVDPRHALADEGWLVTGASGGVGMLAVATLAAAGRTVVACTRKPAAAAALRGLGAARVVAPDEVVDPSPKSLVGGRWAGVVDTVGGNLLAEVLRGVRPGGAVAAIGMAGGADLVTTVHPFILRGVTLAGIDAALLPSQADRRRLWARLADLWPTVRGRLPVTTLSLEEVGDHAARMLRGESIGRGVVLP